MSMSDDVDDILPEIPESDTVPVLPFLLPDYKSNASTVISFLLRNSAT